MGFEPARIVEMVNEARDAITVRRVYGDPIERGDVTIVPAAAIRGGGGAGGGSGPGEEGQGAGGGFGVVARPTGVFVIKDGRARWEPALDLNRVIAGGQVLAAVGLLVLRSWLKHRKRA